MADKACGFIDHEREIDSILRQAGQIQQQTLSFPFSVKNVFDQSGAEVNKLRRRVSIPVHSADNLYVAGQP